MLVGRDAERGRVDRLLAAARAGRSGALVLRGEAGIGKTALVEHAAATAGELRVLRAVGVEADAELPFAALHQMLFPHLDRVDGLPAAQAAALHAAFGTGSAAASNRFQVGAATLSLLAELADEVPVLCLVDDAQWLDRASTDALLFAARRFRDDPIAMLFAVRDTAAPFPMPGIEPMVLGALEPAIAAELLDGSVPDLPAPVRRRVLEESDGNPLALLELGGAQRGGDPAELVGPLPVRGRVQEAFRAQIGGLPGPARTALLVAASDGAAPLDTVVAVAARFGVTVADLAPAERLGLVSVDRRGVAFRHPLVRAAAYQSPTHHERLAVHGAYAAELAGPGDPDRRAWHLAAATTAPDEEAAAELERTAVRARHRGGVSAVSAAYDRAARLSPDHDERARRLTLAAQAAWDAGRADRAARLAGEAESYSATPAVTAEAMFVRAQVEYDRATPVLDGELSLRAARLVLDRDPVRAAAMLSEVALVGRHTGRHDLVAEAARHLRDLRPPAGSDPAMSVAAQIGWAELFAGRADRGAPALRALLSAAQERPLGHADRIVAGIGGLLVAADAAAVGVLEEMVADTRAAGALGWMPYAIEFLVLATMLRGQVVEARSLVTEGIALADELGYRTATASLRANAVWVAAISGDDGCHALAADALPEVDARTAVGAAIARWGLALHALAAGRPADALRLLDEACTPTALRDVLVRAVPDHVEAALRRGDPDAARRHLPELDRWAEQVGGPVARGLALRAHALLADDDDDADELFRAAAAIQDGYDLARTRLAHGEWLRRRRRRSDAHAELDAAARAFTHLGILGWAARAQVELDGLGERPVARPGAPDLLQRLTPQEAQVVRLAAGGLSNKEIGAQLFLSPRTVGHHLYRSFPKLGIGRRMELTQLDL